MAKDHPLAKYRADRGITQVALASELGVTDVTVWRWEHGKRFPHPKLAKRISEHTKIPVGELLDSSTESDQ